MSLYCAKLNKVSGYRNPPAPTCLHNLAEEIAFEGGMNDPDPGWVIGKALVAPGMKGDKIDPAVGNLPGKALRVKGVAHIRAPMHGMVIKEKAIFRVVHVDGDGRSEFSVKKRRFPVRGAAPAG